MSSRPYFKFWHGDFLADTTHLSAAETGAYVMLLVSAWRTKTCGLPDNDRDLSRWARCSAKEWAKIKPRVMPFWTMCPDGLWRQRRLLEEFVLVSQKGLVRSAARMGKSLKLNNVRLTFDELLSVVCPHSQSYSYSSYSLTQSERRLTQDETAAMARLRLVSRNGP